MKCTKCGELLDENANFCGNCGQPVEKIEDKEEKSDLDKTKIFHKDQLEDDSKEVTGDTLVRGLDTEELGEAEKDSKVEDYYDEEDLEGTMIMDSVDEEYYEDYDDEEEEREGFFGKISKNKGLVIGITIALIALISFMVLGGKGGSGNKEELVDNFIEALVARDSSDVRKMLESPIPDLQIDNAGVERLFEYIDVNPSFIQQTKTELERQSKFYDDNKADDIGDITSNVMLRKKDRNEYFLEITPYYMDIGVGAEGTKIFIEDKEVTVADRDDFSMEFGPFMPGVYKIGAKYDADYAELETDQIIELIDDSPDSTKQIKQFQIQLESNSITIVTEDGSAEIILNGEKTGKKVSDLEGGILSPIDSNAKIQLSLETPFGEFKSEEYLVSESGDRLDIEIKMVNDSLKEDIISAVNVFIKDDLKAQEDLDIGVYTNLINPEKDKRAKLLEEMKNEGYNIESELKKTTYDLNSIIITKHEGKYYSNADVNYDVTEKYLWEFTTETREENKNLNVYLRYNESSSKWEVFEIESSNAFDSSNVKQFNN